ncbi:MAG: radical SAM protein, partial [Bacteroidota bacterium]|nr:radical SAM protein [Bacteroidota bacterium]
LLGQGQLQFGISYISSVLKEAGHQTELLVLNGEQEGNAAVAVEDAIRRFFPDMVAMTCVSTQFPFIDRMARHIRRAHPDMYLVIGGPHISLSPENAAAGVYDAACIGEGEYPMLELTEQLSAGRHPSGIANMWLRGADGTMEKNENRPFIQDLDALPQPDRGMWKPWVDTSDPYLPTVLLGRGCPHRCTYCSNHALHCLSEGRYVRFRAPERIVAEIEEVRSAADPHIHTVFLEIDTITADKDWTHRLCDALQRYNSGLQRPLRFRCNFRITRHANDDALFRALAEANIRHLNIGLEAGSERIRKEVLHRRYSNEEFRDVVALARKYDIAISLFNMIGIPGETPEDHMETVRLNREARPAEMLTSIFYPYPGTELHRVCVERELIPAQQELKSERRSAYLDLPEFPRRRVQRAYDLFEWRVSKGRLPLHVRLRKLLRRYISKSDLVNRVFMSLLPIWHRVHPRSRDPFARGEFSA